MRRLFCLGSSAVLVVVVAAAAVGCGGSGGDAAQQETATPPTATTAGTTTPGETESAARNSFEPAEALFRITDMPSGWSEEEASNNGAACGLELVTGAPDKASAQFARAGDVPMLEQDVVAYGDGEATRAMEAADARLADCDTYTKGGIRVAVKPVSFPVFGDQSFAYLLEAEQRGVRFTAIATAIRVGDGITALVYSDLGSAEVSAAEDFAERGAAKLRDAVNSE